MSYSAQDARLEFEARYHEVLDTRDVEGARELAHLLMEMHDEEMAEKFIQFARIWEDEDEAHDRNNNN